jgi:hypothetical protein
MNQEIDIDKNSYAYLKKIFNVRGPEVMCITREMMEEVLSAIKKHPTWPECSVQRAAIIMEEAGEVIREANHIREGHRDKAHLRAELIQLGGTVYRMLMIMDVLG